MALDSKDLLQSISEFLDETTSSSTTANVATYTQPLGSRIDRFISDGEEDEEDDEEMLDGGHLLGRHF